MVARKIQPKLEEMQYANPFKKAFLIFKYVVLGNKSAKCTIPREALESFARTILPDIIAFFETQRGIPYIGEVDAENTKGLVKRAYELFRTDENFFKDFKLFS